MFSLLTGVPGTDELRALVRKVDTARHHGVPDGCVLELDLLSVPNETGGCCGPAVVAGVRGAAGESPRGAPGAGGGFLGGGADHASAAPGRRGGTRAGAARAHLRVQ